MQCMFPQIVISSLEKYIEPYICSMQKKYAIPDSHIYRYHPVKTEFSIDLIRDIKRCIITSTSHPRLIVLFAFNTASHEAQNALLKTIEESTAHVLFLMIVNRADTLLPTLQSRSITISLDPPGQSSSIAHTFLIDDLITLYAGAPLTRDTAHTLLLQQISCMRTALPKHPILLPIMKKAIRFSDLLYRNNIQPQLAVDAITLDARRALATERKND